MQVSNDHKFLVVISGKNLVMNEQFINQMFIFKRKINPNDGLFRYDLYKRIKLVEYDEFQKICMKFYFKETK